MKKILTIFFALFIIMQIICVVSFAEDVNTFPPQRPAVGNMKVVSHGRNTMRGFILVGLRTNGTINYLEGLNDNYSSRISNDSKATLLGMTNIVDIACTYEHIAVLKDNGTVYATEDDLRITDDLFLEANSWTDIVAIDCGREHLVGLKSDGTVVATGENGEGQCNVLGWNNVSKIFAYGNTTVAIRKDGSVLVSGEIDNSSELIKQKNVKEVIYNDDYERYTVKVLTNDGIVNIKENAYVKDNEITWLGGGGTKEELDLNTIIAMLGHSEKIESIKAISYGSYYLFLDELGDLYSLSQGHYGPWKLEKLEENIIGFIVDGNKYYAWDENGQIWSDASAFTSSDWILTTNITYNGDKINSDVAPYIKDGRTLAPIRAILEALGMVVSWDDETRTATAVKDDITISVTINSNIAVVNGEEKVLDVPAEITNSRTFVPVRFFAEALNMNVDWDGFTKTVIIESK